MGKRVKLLIILVLVALLPLPPNAVALALSEVELESHLNQPLSARIRLLEVSAAELENLQVRVSEIPDAVAGGRRAAMRHEVVKDGSNYYLRISGRDAVREPVMNIAVEVNWSTGHLIRNYALIIDPQ